jgi:hypothetical protein
MHAARRSVYHSNVFRMVCRSVSVDCHFSLISLNLLDLLFLVRIYLQVDRSIRVCEQPNPDQWPIFGVGCAPEKAAMSATRT